MIVGHTLGKDSFASVGSTASLIFLIIGFAQGVTNGLTIISAQRFGAGDLEGLKKSFVHGLFYASLISLLLTVSALAFLETYLGLNANACEYHRPLPCLSNGHVWRIDLYYFL